MTEMTHSTFTDSPIHSKRNTIGNSVMNKHGSKTENERAQKIKTAVKITSKCHRMAAYCAQYTIQTGIPSHTYKQLSNLISSYHHQIKLNFFLFSKYFIDDKIR